MNKTLVAILLSSILLPALQGCVPVVAAGVGVGLSSVVDRRSLGTQTEDESIEWKAAARARDYLGAQENAQADAQTHLNFTSFNRKVLISGEVPSSEIKAELERRVLSVPNVESVYNELNIREPSSFSQRSNDSYITTKIKSRSLDGQKFNPIHMKVVTEFGVAFILGMMSQAEADAAIQVARTTAGVKKVINLIEVIPDAKARELDAAKEGKDAPIYKSTGSSA